MTTPTLEEAIAALDEELGPRTPEVPDRPAPRRFYKGSTWVDWEAVADWLYDNPYKAFIADPVHAQAIYRLRKRHPRIVVVGTHHRKEANGRRVGCLWACYQPTAETEANWADA